jgi:HTH-type transcriptional regulator, global nitrogen regulator NrpRI
MEQVGSDAESKVLAILKVLSESGESMGSITIARRLQEDGIFLSERAVRYHLKVTDERGFTEPGGRDGRMITARGRQEVREALAPQQLGLVKEKLETLAYLTTFDPDRRQGLLPINTSLISSERFKKALTAMKEAFKAGLCVSELVATAREGQKLGSVVIPAGMVGLATVCSATINGVLLKSGVPTEFRFGGVLEVREGRPRRFVAIIDYSGTSLDPSDQFIRAGMTTVGLAAKTGNGKILANFRTMPAAAREAVEARLVALKLAGIGGVFVVGGISEPVCQIPVAMNRIGIVQVGGLNPVAAAVEAGVDIENVPESGLIDFAQLASFRTL